MVLGFSLIPSIMGGHDGSNDLCSAPDIDTASTFYGGILRIYRAYFILQSWSKHSSKVPVFFSSTSILLLTCYHVKLGNTILTLISSLAQLACLVWYLVSYFPMGSN